MQENGTVVATLGQYAIRVGVEKILQTQDGSAWVGITTDGKLIPIAPTMKTIPQAKPQQVTAPSRPHQKKVEAVSSKKGRSVGRPSNVELQARLKEMEQKLAEAASRKEQPQAEQQSAVVAA
jgi:hypothetical protein